MMSLSHSQLEVGLPKLPPFRVVFRNSHPAPTGNAPPGWRVSYTTFTEKRSPLYYLSALPAIGSTAT